jgi:hypothetical protein
MYRLWGEELAVVIQVLPIPAKSVGHLLDGDAHRGLAVRAWDVAVLALITLVQISWLTFLFYGAKSLVG